MGYGAMLSDPKRRAQQAAAAERAEQRKQIAKRQREEQQAQQAVPWPGARVKFNRNNGALTVEKDGRNATALAPKGKELLETLPPEIQKKYWPINSSKITAYVCDKTVVRVEIP
ncbi:MAG TPA: hypothetical protein VNL74_00095 [Methylococcus sp.]|nr:hypothetical protein [Methylococcus sp.]